MSTNNLVNSYKCGHPVIQDAFMAGYDVQINAGLGVLCQVLWNIEHEVKKPDCKILIFGMAGIGKSLYPKALMKCQCENTRVKDLLESAKEKIRINGEFSLFHVNCLDVVGVHTDISSLSTFLDMVEQQIADNIPAMVIFDELDAFSPERVGQSRYINHWTMKFMKQNHDGLALFGIANRPVVLDSAVTRQFKHLFYFELPDETTVKKILEHFEIPNPNAIARKLCTNLVDAGELIHGCEDAIQFLGNGDPKNLTEIDTEELADFIGDYLKTPWKKKRDYENANHFYIGKAKRHMTFWNDRKEALMGT